MSLKNSKSAALVLISISEEKNATFQYIFFLLMGQSSKISKISLGWLEYRHMQYSHPFNMSILGSRDNKAICQSIQWHIYFEMKSMCKFRKPATFIHQNFFQNLFLVKKKNKQSVLQGRKKISCENTQCAFKFGLQISLFLPL